MTFIHCLNLPAGRQELEIGNWKLEIILVLFIPFSIFLFPSSASAATLSKPPNNLGLVAYYSFEDGSGSTATDFSGNGNTGTLTNMEAADWVDGKIGKALSFGGVDEYVDISGSNLSTLSSSFTLATWAKFNNVNGAFLIEKASPNNGANFYIWWSANDIGLGNSWIFGFRNSQNTAWKDHAYVNTPTAGIWYHVVFVFDDSGNTANLYLDGALVKSEAETDSPYYGSENLKIATNSNADSSYSLNGQIDEVRIYNRALSATEVASLYERTSQAKITSPTNDGLVGYWSFEDATGTKATDFSGNGNTGTLTNMEAADWVAGKRGKALSFDGVDDYVVTSGFTVPMFGTHTISFWGRIIAYDSNGTIFVSSKDSSGTKSFYQIGSNLGTYGGNQTGYVPFDNLSSGNNDNIWRHYTYVFNSTASSAQLFINGTQHGATKTYSTAISNNLKKIYIGSYASTDGWNLNGSIDDVRIYNRALSQAEITKLYNETAVRVNASQNNRLTEGLVGLWSFNGQDVDTTTAYDRSGQGGNSTILNPPHTPTFVSGKVGQALNFDNDDPDSSGVAGIKQYISITHTSALDPSTGMSVSVWVRQTSNVKQTAGIIDKNRTNSWALYFEESVNKIAFNWKGTEVIKSGYDLNEWYHIVGTWDGSTQIIYVDGALANQTANSSTPTGTDNILVGKLSDGFNLYGQVDEVRVYNRALSAAEVLQLYNLGR